MPRSTRASVAAVPSPPVTKTTAAAGKAVAAKKKKKKTRPAAATTTTTSTTTTTTTVAAQQEEKKNVATTSNKKKKRKSSATPSTQSVYDMVGQPRVYTQAEVTAMSPEELTAAINREAVRLLHSKEGVSATIIPFTGDRLRNNPFATALLANVPDDRYKPDNVWRVKANGEIEFAEWLWRVGTAPAMNRFAHNYSSTKKPSDPEFPIEAFAEQRRRVRNRGHKRKGHDREREAKK